MQKFLQFLLKIIEKAEIIFCVVTLCITTLFICATIANRYIFHYEIMWLNDFALYIFVFFMFTAAAVTASKEGHISIEMFRNRLFKNKPVGGALYKIFLDALSIIILLVFFPVAYQFMKRAIQYPEWGTLVRWFNTSWLQIYLFVALLLVLMHLTIIFVRDIWDFIKRQKNLSSKGAN
jgi:TRAP-type C4-dicarboxylate transport system permease small subunit